MTDDILAGLNKKTRDLFKKAVEINDEKIVTASFGLNQVLDGGVDKGHQTTFWGNESAGKSALWLQTIGLNQKLGMKCAYIDAERTFKWKWAERLGVDVKALEVARVNSIADFADAGVDLIKSGFDLIVVDSTSALMPDMFFDEHGDIKNFDDAKQLGRFAAEMGRAAKMHLSQNWGTAIIHISQLRKEVGGPGKGTPDIPTGGKELRHLDSLRIKLTSSASDSYAIKQDIAYGDNLVEEAVGRTVTWVINKNKMNGKYGSGDYDLYFRGDNVGIDRPSELFEYGKRYGIIEGSKWYYLYGEKAQGKPNMIKYIKANPNVADKLENEIYAKSL